VLRIARTNLKKQSQFTRSVFSVPRAAEGHLKNKLVLSEVECSQFWQPGRLNIGGKPDRLLPVRLSGEVEQKP
jgi:hypothetical protein